MEFLILDSKCQKVEKSIWIRIQRLYVAHFDLRSTQVPSILGNTTKRQVNVYPLLELILLKLFVCPSLWFSVRSLVFGLWSSVFGVRSPVFCLWLSTSAVRYLCIYLFLCSVFFLWSLVSCPWSPFPRPHSSVFGLWYLAFILVFGVRCLVFIVRPPVHVLGRDLSIYLFILVFVCLVPVFGHWYFFLTFFDWYLVSDLPSSAFGIYLFVVYFGVWRLVFRVSSPVPSLRSSAFGIRCSVFGVRFWLTGQSRRKWSWRFKSLDRSGHLIIITTYYYTCI